MPTTDPTTILIKHDRWATANMLEACRSLSNEQFHQSFEMGPGSLHDTLNHILGAMQGWGDLLAGREQRKRVEEEQRTIDEMAELHARLADEIEALTANHANDEIVSGSRGGRSYSFARGAVITHLTTHGMHHRAQCLNMLRQLGVDPLPNSAVVEWILMVDDQ